MNTAHKLAADVTQSVKLPAVYHNIRDLLLHSEASVDDFADVIMLDSALALRIIKISNSQFFGHSRKTETVNQAISRIGTFQLHDLLLSCLAVRAFSIIPIDIFNQQIFWRSGIYCGIVARMLAQKCMLPAKERLFSAGLLHEIGHIVMFAKTPDQTQEAIIESQMNNTPLFEIERQMLGFDYGEVGSKVMQLWHLPQAYCDIARFHMEPELAERHEFEIQIVNLARSIMLAEEQSLQQSLRMCLESNNLINNVLNEQDINDIQMNARTHVDEVMDCLYSFPKEIKESNLFTMRTER